MKKAFRLIFAAVVLSSTAFAYPIDEPAPDPDPPQPICFGSGPSRVCIEP